MSEENFDKSLSFLLKSEGGFVQNPKDPGGATNLGVTKATWEKYKGRAVSVDEIKALTPSDVEPLYKQMYWNALKCDELPSGLDYCLFDVAVNSGPVRAIRMLQTAVNAPVTGVMTDTLVQLANRKNTEDLICSICNERLQFMQQLNTWDAFGKGWTSRVNSVKKQSLSMLS